MSESVNDVFLPWYASDYLDWANYKHIDNYGIVDDRARIIVGYDGKLTEEQANRLSEIANKNEGIALFLQNLKSFCGTQPLILKLILKVMP